MIAEGKMTASGFQSKFSLNVSRVAIAGEGALMAMLEKRKKALAAEGLFAPERKQELPYLPGVIGVITSPQGAVIRDILHRLRDRFPRKVLIWPVAVQGEKCAPEVANAIKGFNAFTPGGALPRPDLLIVARGGGSIEDLWGFNEEVVARAAAASDIPLISAVGHETDTTLIDFVSDQRAPTPTAAAELAVPVRIDLLAWVDAQSARLTRAASNGVSQRDQRLRDLSRALPRPEMLVGTASQKLDLWGERLPKALTALTARNRVRLSDRGGALRPSLLRQSLNERQRQIEERAARLPLALSRRLRGDRQRFDQIAGRLTQALMVREQQRKSDKLAVTSARFAETAKAGVRQWRDQLDGLERLRQTLGYTETLKRGFAVVRQGESVVTSKDQVDLATAVEIQFSDGRIEVAGTPDALRPAAKKVKPKKPAPDAQGDLF